MLNRLDEIRIAAAASVDPRTVRKLYRGGSVNPAIAVAIKAAAMSLRIAPPATGAASPATVRNY